MANPDKTKLDDGTPKPPSQDAAAAEIAALKARLSEQEALANRLNSQLESTESRLAHVTSGMADANSPERKKALLDRKNGKRKSQMTKADYEEKRKAIKAAAFEQNGFKYYRNSREMFYRQGVCTPPYGLIKLPVEEDPSHTWEPAKSATLRSEAAQGDDRVAMSDIAKGKGNRAADQSVG